MTRREAALVLLAIGVSGCHGSGPRDYAVADVEGRTFAAHCDGECPATLVVTSQGAVARPRAQPSATTNEPVFILARQGGRLQVCDGWRAANGQRWFDGRDCRAVTCTDDSGCPALGGEPSPCVGGQCSAAPNASGR